MTLIAACIGVVKKGSEVSSMYFASDSRFSWGGTKSSPRYDEGMKVFCSLQHPYTFAYCGNVLFPLHTLERIIIKIDCDLFFEQTDEQFSNKLSSIRTEIESSLINYSNPKPSFTILLASRESYYNFHLGKITSIGGSINHGEIILPKQSKIVEIQIIDIQTASECSDTADVVWSFQCAAPARQSISRNPNIRPIAGAERRLAEASDVGREGVQWNLQSLLGSNNRATFFSPLRKYLGIGVWPDIGMRVGLVLPCGILALPFGLFKRRGGRRDVGATTGTI